MPHSEHLHHMQRVHKKQKTSAFDRLIIVISIAYPLSSLPQLISVYRGNTEGVSILSWLIFLICASLFLAYGIRHRVTPMIVANSLWIIVDSMIVIGLLIRA